MKFGKKKPDTRKVFVSVLCGDERGGWMHPRLALFLLEIARNPAVTFHFSLDVRPVFHARNRIVEAFLKTDADWLLQIDNDVAPPTDLLRVLEKVPAAAAVVTPKVYIPTDVHPFCLGWRPVGETDTRGWQELSDCATACVFTRRDVFAKLQKPYFDFGYLADGSLVTEDLVFCNGVREAGLRIFGNRNFTCSHFRTVDLRLAEKSPEFNFQCLYEHKQKAKGASL
jgi:GT2 family glycosyltransferase